MTPFTIPPQDLLETRVNNRYFLLCVSKAVGPTLVLGILISACASLPAIGGTTWKEEVLLHDGSKIVVERSVVRGGRHEIGQRPPYSEQSLAFTLPKSGKKLTWQDHYSKDIGTASFLPMLLDIAEGIPYLVATPMGCLSYNKWGRPNPPYVVFRYERESWQRIPLAELPDELRATNLIVSMPDVKAEESGKRLMSAEAINAIVTSYRQPEYRSILRESIPNAGGRGCGEMVGNGKGVWEGIGWFKKQPSIAACLHYCVQRDFSDQYCPCNRLFKGE